MSLVADDVQNSCVDRDWNPESDQFYPLTVEEGNVLLAGMPEHAATMVKLFTDNVDGDRGTASLAELLEATGHSKPENIGKLVSWTQLRVCTATGDPDAGLVNWHPEDWILDEQENLYSAGIYYINAIAAQAIKEAIE